MTHSKISLATLLFSILGLILVSFVLFPRTGLAERQKIAVLEFKGSNLDETQEEFLSIFTDRVRESVLVLLDKKRFQLYTKENMEPILEDMDIDPGCITTTCEVKIARAIQAEYVISGVVMKIDSKYLVTIKIHNSNDGTPVSIVHMEEYERLHILTKTKKTIKSALIEADLLKREKESFAYEKRLSEQEYFSSKKNMQQGYPLTEKNPLPFNVGGAAILALGSLGALYTYNEGMNPNISQGTLIGFNIANIACWGLAIGGGFYMLEGNF